MKRRERENRNVEYIMESKFNLSSSEIRRAGSVQVEV